MTYQRPNPRTKYCGVYGIKCTVTGEMYIGASVDMTGRWTHHRFMLRRGKHKTPGLQQCWLTYGEINFEFIVLERCEKSALLTNEDKWVKATANRLNWADCATPIHTGPSDIKKQAARKKWANPLYYAKRAGWLMARGKDGRFQKSACGERA